MILERHYDEESLIAILNCGKDAVSRDTHLAACESCAQTVEAYQAIAEVLGSESVWSFSDNSDERADCGAAAIRAFVEKMESEDADAVELVDELLKLPRQWWIPTVVRDASYHNAGVVRRLTEVSEAKIKTVPAQAVEIAAAAVALRSVLPETNAMLQVVGLAYRQHAYALFYVGDFVHALESVEEGQQLLERCPAADYALAHLDIVRSLVYSRLERFDEAMHVSRKAASVFQTFGNVERYASARLGEAYLLIQARNDRAALDVLGDIRKQLWPQLTLDIRARLLSNLGGCHWNLGHIPDALEALQLAAELYSELRNDTEAARVQYNVALLLAAEGRHADAKTRLRAAITDFERLGMAQTAVVAGLDLAEIELLQQNFEEVEHLCRAAMRQFEAAGIPYSREALTALTFLREAAEQRRATQETVWHVKTYIRRLPDEPALLFAPAPLPPA